MSMETFTDANFEKEVLGSSELVLVDFWATWCAPCKQIPPILEELMQDYSGRVRFGKLDVSDNTDTAAKFGVKSVPVVMYFKGGEMVENVPAVHPKDYYQKLIDKHVG